MTSTGRRRLRIGCSGWNYRHWRERFYPRGLPASRWLEHYAKTFDTVEVNATFYRLPTRKAVAHWAEVTPESFVFAVKASRYLTHVKRLRGLDEGWPRLFERIEPLASAGKLGPVLWQLPETFHRDDDRLAAALGALPPDGMPSSSATRAGSCPRSRPSCASTAPRSSSATIPSGPSSPTC
jgi:uncharacterized protein YecE (DUF72 family)